MFSSVKEYGNEIVSLVKSVDRETSSSQLGLQVGREKSRLVLGGFLFTSNRHRNLLGIILIISNNIRCQGDNWRADSTVY